MKSKLTNKGNLTENQTSKNEDREEITLTVFVVFFLITLGMLYMAY